MGWVAFRLTHWVNPGLVALAFGLFRDDGMDSIQVNPGLTQRLFRDDGMDSIRVNPLHCLFTGTDGACPPSRLAGRSARIVLAVCTRLLDSVKPKTFVTAEIALVIESELPVPLEG